MGRGGGSLRSASVPSTSSDDSLDWIPIPGGPDHPPGAYEEDVKETKGPVAQDSEVGNTAAATETSTATGADIGLPAPEISSSDGVVKDINGPLGSEQRGDTTTSSPGRVMSSSARETPASGWGSRTSVSQPKPLFTVQGKETMSSVAPPPPAPSPSSSSPPPVVVAAIAAVAKRRRGQAASGDDYDSRDSSNTGSSSSTTGKNGVTKNSEARYGDDAPAFVSSSCDRPNADEKVDDANPGTASRTTATATSRLRMNKGGSDAIETTAATSAFSPFEQQRTDGCPSPATRSSDPGGVTGSADGNIARGGDHYEGDATGVEWERAWALLSEMQGAGLKPPAEAFAVVLGACVNCGKIGEALEIAQVRKAFGERRSTTRPK